MQQQQMNIDALKRAMDLMFGAQATELAAKLYIAINGAQQAAFNDGHLKGYTEAYAIAKEEAEANIEERLDRTFDNGFIAGADAAEAASGIVFDEGYVAGVADARARPEVADAQVMDIINAAARHALNGEYDAELVTDSGDEHVFYTATRG